MLSEAELSYRIEEEFRNRYGPRVAVVLSVTGNTVRALPLVRMPLVFVDNERTVYTDQSAQEAPLVYPSSSAGQAQVKVVPGDLVLLINLQLDHSRVFEGATSVVDPDDPALYDQNDVVALPFSLNLKDAGGADAALLGNTVNLGIAGAFRKLVDERAQEVINTSWSAMIAYVKANIAALVAANIALPLVAIPLEDLPAEPPAPVLPLTTNTKAS